MMRNSYVGREFGNYRVVSQLASGAFGSIYKGKHTIFTNRPVVAIKLLHTHLSSQEERDRFFQEARLLELLKHPHILPIIDAGVHEGFPYLVVAYAPGGSLRDRLQHQSSPPLSVEEAIPVLSQIGQALHYAHQQHVIHRDIKPENILFNEKGDALLADFGIATVLTTASAKQTTILGTPSYMAPEQFRGIISSESDQYALGCIAYELLTLRKPFTAPDLVALMFKHVTEHPVPPKQLNPQLPVHVEQAILKAMEKERINRHADVSSFIKAFSGTKEQWLEEGNAYYKARRKEEALAAFEQAILCDPNDASLYNHKGRALMGRYIDKALEALEAFEQAIRLDPNNADAYCNKGTVLRWLDRDDEALAMYDRAIELAPDAAWQHHNKAIHLKELGRDEESLQSFRLVTRLDPNNVDAWANIWDILTSGRIDMDKEARRREARQAHERVKELGGHALIALAEYDPRTEPYEDDDSDDDLYE